MTFMTLTHLTIDIWKDSLEARAGRKAALYYAECIQDIDSDRANTIIESINYIESLLKDPQTSNKKVLR